MTHASLFSGIGGFDLAAEWAGWTNVFNCEIDPFCRKVLAYHFPNAIQYEDVKATDFTVHRGGVDVLTGGFPCQPFSLAGKRRGTSDNRYLWPEMLRAIREIRPRWVVGENVLGIVNWSDGMVFEQVCADLEGEGYEVQPFLIPACAVDAPHRRDRVWFVAHRRTVEDPISDGSEREPCISKTEPDKREQRLPCAGVSKWVCGAESAFAADGGNAGIEVLQRERTISVCSPCATPNANRDRRGKGHKQNQPEQPKWERVDSFGEEWAITDTDQFGNRPPEESGTPNGVGTKNASGARCGGSGSKRTDRRADVCGVNSNTEVSRGGKLRNARSEKGARMRNELSRIECAVPNWEQFPTQPPVCGRDDGISARLDGITFPRWRRESIKAYGNAVVPQVVLQIFKTINEL